jgi:hypothetical protein
VRAALALYSTLNGRISGRIKPTDPIANYLSAAAAAAATATAAAAAAASEEERIDIGGGGGGGGDTHSEQQRRQELENHRPPAAALEIIAMKGLNPFGNNGGQCCPGHKNQCAHDMAAVAPDLFWVTAQVWAVRFAIDTESQEDEEEAEEEEADVLGVAGSDDAAGATVLAHISSATALEAERGSRLAAERETAQCEVEERQLAVELARTQSEIARARRRGRQASSGGDVVSRSADPGS